METGRQTTVGLSTTIVFSVFAGCVFGNFTTNSSDSTARYACIARYWYSKGNTPTFRWKLVGAYARGPQLGTLSIRRPIGYSKPR